MKIVRLTATITLLFGFISPIISAAPLYWDAGGTSGASLGGTGNWDQASLLWFGGTGDIAWINANNDDAIFSGTGGTVTLTENIAAGDLYFTNVLGSVIITNATGAETLTLANGIVDTGGTTNTIGAPLAGSSALTKNGDGILVLSRSNTGFSGPVIVNQGALQTTTPGALGTGTVTVTNSGSVEFNSAAIIPNAFTISGGGVNGEGALFKVTSSTITNSGAITLETTNIDIGGNSGTGAYYYIEGGLAADSGVNANVVFGGGASFRISYYATSKAVKLGAGSITVNGGGLNVGATSLTYSNLVLNGGQFSSGLSDKSFGVAPSAFQADNITISNGANVLLSHTFTLNANRGIYLGLGGGLFGENTGNAQVTIPGVISGPGSLLFETDGSGASWKLTGTNTYTGTTTVQSGVALYVGNNGGAGTLGVGDTTDNGSIIVNRTGTFTYVGAISGAGILTLEGAGTMILSGASTYTGNTTDEAQYLLVNNTSGSGTGTGALTVGTGSGGSYLSGNGIISGPVSLVAATSPNVLQPGNFLNNSIGTLTISNSLTLPVGNMTIMLINATTNSAITGMTSMTYGGTLIVSNISATAPAPGQTYQLFSAASYSGSFEAGLQLPSLPAGLTWNTNNLYINGSISVSGLNGVFNPPVVSGTNLILSGTSGTPNGLYSVLATTNLTLPVASWTVLSSGNTLDNNGNFSFTNALDPNAPQEFFMLQQP